MTVLNAFSERPLMGAKLRNRIAGSTDLSRIEREVR
jgi:hypothetical protein